MSLPLATTTGSVLRAPEAVPGAPEADGWDPAPADADLTVVASGIRSVLSQQAAVEDGSGSGSGRQVTRVRLLADPCDLKHGDKWRDDPTGQVFEVGGVVRRNDLGMAHVLADLTLSTGAV